MKIEVDTMRKKFGPAQCYRCHGFFHSSRFCTRNPKCVKCGKPHLTRDCTKKREEEPTCCHCQGNPPANYTGCPQNPMNRPPPPPKVNFWEERARKKEMLDAAKAKNEQAEQPQKPAPTQAQVTSSSRKPQTPPPATNDKPQARDLSSSTQETSSPRTPPTRPSANPQNPHSMSEVFSQVNDPEVCEMVGVIKKFITISKKDRLSHRGGGTVILIKRTIAHHSISLHIHALENTTIIIEGNKNLTISCVYRPPRSPPLALIPDLLRIFRNRTCCIIVGDYNAKHTSWNPHSQGNKCDTQLHKFTRDCGFLISSPAGPTTVPRRSRDRPATLDFAVSCGINNILVDSHAELSSDHNPVQFIFETTIKPYSRNCTAFTNWSLYQELLTASVPGNPITSDTDRRNCRKNFPAHK
ncbi:putative RNA-directed DNA polymerase from transposon X-element [Trichonephila clavipes]|nr:putative RNA-directed DNA polymerase from transposon X-element [Trichonephila clavipes]